MQAASTAYKAEMKECYRKQSFMRVSIGVINQEAQANATVINPEQYTYYSNLNMPLQNYQVEELYAACCQDYTPADGSMYFLPRRREDVVLNQGIVTEKILGSIEIRFPIPYEIKGVTIEFGNAYPVDFTIESDGGAVLITGNNSGHFVTEEIFEGATFLRFVPSKMVNGQSRLRIHQITMGIGIYFDNRKILSATKREYINPVTEELPSIDFDLAVENKDRAFDVENEESTVNFLEVGQEISVIYGQELEDGSIEWMPGTVVRLREWSADDEQMSFSATDRFEDLDGTYYKGKYRPEGISLYDLALDVLEDAEVDSRTYWIDPYLRKVIVFNPLPAVSYKEALQLIANAGRCVLYQNREGKIYMKSSFLPDMTAVSDNETYFSRASSVLDGQKKDSYAMGTKDYTDAVPTQFFLPQNGSGFLQTGYISEQVAAGDGSFSENPTVEICAEAAFKCFGMTLKFSGNPPQEVVIHSYYGEELRENYVISDLTKITVIQHEFPEFDRMVLEFAKGAPHNRVTLDNVVFGDSTDYTLSYGRELTKTPKGTQLTKVKELQVIRTLYHSSDEVKELARETIEFTAAYNHYTFYFGRASYDFSCMLENAQAGQSVKITESSNYYATVEIMGISGACEISITGKEYITTQAKVSRALHPTGKVEVWENPLISDMVHAADMADWIGDYLKSDREYQELQYRGEARIDANDLVFLENKYVPDLLLRVYEHTLKFSGALSGSIKARRDMGYVADAENRLAAK